MWLDEADGFAELFKGYLPYYLLVALPIFIIMSPVSPVAASHEFSVYRMQQYDLHTVPHGSRSSSINLEGRSLTSWATSRHCVVARIQDISIDQLMEIRSKAGGLLLVMPRNDTALSEEMTEHIQLLEMAMAQQEFHLPVYLVNWSPEIETVLEDLNTSFITDDKSGTALEAMINGVSSNGYQIVVSAAAPHKVDARPVSLHGRLAGRSAGAKGVLVVAHYDAAGLAPDLAVGADSNASGAVALLELARVFSRLYADAGARAAAPIQFLLTGSGRALNYFSAKKWLEDQIDAVESSFLQETSFVLCLDSVSARPSLRAHVSKPPAAGGAAHSLLARLDAPLVHKRINLADEALSWEHERFSIRRLSAFTLSSLESHKAPSRGSLLDTPSEAAVANLVLNIRAVARALASHLYNLTDTGEDGMYDEILSVEESSVRQWYSFLASQPRAPLALAGQAGQAAGASAVTSALSGALSRYLGAVAQSAHAADKRELEFALYAPSGAVLNVYSVKPAVFDLILTLAIAAYLGLIYVGLQYFPAFYREYSRFVVGKKVQ